MNIKLTLKTIGQVLLVESALMLIPLAVALLCGGETTAWQTFQDIGRVLNYVARIFSAGSSIVNNVVTIVNYFNKLEDLLPVIGEV